MCEAGLCAATRTQIKVPNLYTQTHNTKSIKAIFTLEIHSYEQQFTDRFGGGSGLKRVERNLSFKAI